MIETSRLILKPLTYGQLVKYAECDHSLEEELNINKTSRIISPDLKEALEQTILPNVADPEKNYLYSTLWTAISKVENKMIGDLCILGEPNEDGEIEIGYGTYDEFQNRGYMTELVGGIMNGPNPSQKSNQYLHPRIKQTKLLPGCLKKTIFYKSEKRILLTDGK